MNASLPSDPAEQLEQAIAALEAQRAILGDAVIDVSIAALREKLAALTPVQPLSPDLHGERRQATILLADVKGSTELAEQVDTETWVEIMNRVFHLLGDAIYRYGGEIDQYRGDGLVAFFGAKATHEDDPERAVRAALAMQEAAKGYAAELKAAHGIDLLLRVGVNTGEVIAAEVGDRQRHSEDTAMGRAIALAARMESAAQPGTVLVTAHTYHLTRPLFAWQSLGEIRVKGVSQPVTVYRPLAASTIEDKGRGIEGLSSPLVGRDEELAALRRVIDDLQRGVGGIVTLVGEAGIGKSRLVAELRKRVLGEQVQWVEGRCLSYGGSIAYLLWLDMLRSVLRVAPDALPATVQDALRAQVQILCPDCFDQVYPYLCRLMSLPLGDQYAVIRDLQGESLRAEVFWSVQALVESAARQRPLVLVCEDLHWADATSLALLERVLALTDRAALLLICVFRPEVEHPCWQLKETAARLYRHRHTDLWLDALSADESQTLVGHLLQIEDLPQELRAKILDHAEGNPFYVEEILRTLIDDGAIIYDDTTGHWQATREIAGIPIPDTLHGVLSARIDRLQEETRRVLRLASVIGRVFFYRVLAEIARESLAREEAQLDTRLLTLQRQQLIRERARVPELEYIFKHDLTREAAYNGLLKREQHIYHRQVAEALERLFPDQIDEQAGLLAYHWERAEEPEKAVTYLLKAGEQARLAYANEEAVSYFQRALTLMDQCSPEMCSQEWRLVALSGLGKVCYSMGRVRDAESPLREAISLAETMGKPVRERVRLFWWLGETLFWLGRAEDMLKLAEKGAALLAEDQTCLEAVLMNQHIATASTWKGDRERYFEFADRVIRSLKNLSYIEELRPAYILAAESRLGTKRTQEAQTWLAALETVADRAHDLRGLDDAYRVYGLLFYSISDLKRAVEYHLRAVEYWSRIGDAKNQARSLSDLGMVHLCLGRLEEAESYIRRALSCVSVEEFKPFMPNVCWTQGTTLLSQGRWQEALDVYEKGYKLVQEWGDPLSSAAFSVYQAYTYLAQGHYEKASGLFETAIHVPDPALWTSNSINFLVICVGLERAYQDSHRFQSFCQRFRREYAEVLDSPFQTWYQVKTTARKVGIPLVEDMFTEPLSSDWVWTDVFGDCSYTIRDGLEIRAANRGLRDTLPSSPCLLQHMSGDLNVQTVCVPGMDDRPSIGGLLLWKDEKNYLQLVCGLFGKHEIAFVGCIENEDIAIGRGRLCEASECTILRLERTGDRVEAFCSADGEQWYTVGQIAFSVNDPVQVGIHAIGGILRIVYPGAYPEGTAIRFESFQLWAQDAGGQPA